MTLMELALKNITNRKFRTAINIFVISIAVGIFVMTYSLSENINKIAHQEILDKSIQNEIDVTAYNKEDFLTYNDILTIKQLKNVNYVTPKESIFVGIMTDMDDINNNVIAATLEGINFNAINSYICAGNIDDSEHCCVVPQMFVGKDIVYYGESLLGTEIEFEYTLEKGKVVKFTRTVGAIYDATNLDLAENTILLDSDDLEKALASVYKISTQQYIQQNQYLEIKVYVADENIVDETRDEIKNLGYNAIDINDKQNNVIGIVKYILWIGSGISIIIKILACSSIASMMLNSVNSRRKEIGILKAIGMENIHIRKIFFDEILIICILSMLIGVGGAQIGLMLMSNRAADIFNMVFSKNLSMKGLLIGGVMGIIVPLIFAAIPIFKAGKIEPAKTMKEE
jgi:ABC-type antimicrobial peptide transport system permease subunit